MSNIQTMIEALDYIEQHLTAEIQVADIAAAVSYSLYHFCRVFNQVVHHTPYDYVMRRRLSEAARALVESDTRIIDVAYDAGFGSPEAFSRAFKRLLGVQPYQWRKRGHLDRRRLCSPVTRAHLEHLHGESELQPQLCEWDALHLVGITSLVQDETTQVAGLWELLQEELARFEIADSPRSHYGLVHYPDHWEQRGILYTAAVDGRGIEVPGSALAQHSLPAASYAHFVHHGDRSKVWLTRDYIYQTWLPRSGSQVAGSYELECYGTPAADEIRKGYALYLPIK